jgi:hypothetical protein
MIAMFGAGIWLVTQLRKPPAHDDSQGLAA